MEWLLPLLFSVKEEAWLSVRSFERRRWFR